MRAALVILLGSMSFITNSVKASNELSITVEDGLIEESFSYEDAIMEKVYINTGVDTDLDGEEDRIYVEVKRPKETKNGKQVPVVYNMSSYNGGLPYPEYHDVDEELYDGKPAAAPTLDDYYAPYFVPRGYAVVTANNIGTEYSDGCPSTGSNEEIQASKAVIDWLNGRVEAYDEDGDKVSADWSTGNVGMIGKSYDGTLANGVAATAVEGLKTIVPIAAISNWYDYYRSNGAVIAPGGYPGDDADRLARGVLTRNNPEVCEPLMDEIEEQQDRKTGNYNEFWDERNYLKNADKIKASVFLVHGLNDVNVQPSQSTELWEVLKQNDTPRKMWLHQGEHDDPRDIRGEEWLTALNKWFAYWLYDIDNGMMDEPRVELEHPNHEWEQIDEWPRENAVNKTLYFNSGHEDEENASLEIEENPSESGEKVTFVDDASIRVKDLIERPLDQSDNRLAYLSPALTESMNLSGVPELTIKAAFDKPAANLSAVLVDYGPEENTVVTRGWIDPKNKDSLSEDVALKENQAYTFSWGMESREYEFKEGHQIGLVIISSDYEYTKRPESGTEITFFPEDSQIVLPLTGQYPGESSVMGDEDISNEEHSNQTWIYVIVAGGLLLILVALWLVYKRSK